jgi:hypothetical protein
METGFLVLVIPGRDTGIAPNDGVRGDPRITSGGDEETTCVGRKILRRRRYPDGQRLTEGFVRLGVCLQLGDVMQDDPRAMGFHPKSAQCGKRPR